MHAGATLLCCMQRGRMHARCWCMQHAACMHACRSGDSTARIWDLSALADGGAPRATVLKHFNKANEKAKDVTTLDWNGSGSLLATGSYDGLARVWSKEGAQASQHRD